MAGSTYSTNLKIELMTTGENSGTWGDITNTNLGTALEQAVVGYGNVDYVSDANLTISITNSNASQPARALVLNVTSTFGSLTQTRELVVPTSQKQYIVQNNTSGGQSITVKTSAGTGITVPNGRKAHLYVNGTSVIQMFDFINILGGTIDNTTLGATTASSARVTTLNASGATTLDGTVALGNAAADIITVPGTIGSNLIFTDNTYDIGASGATRPRNLFLAGAATIGGNLSVGGTLTLTGGVNLNGNVTVGDSAADTLTINSTVTSNLIFTDNTYDIGASGATRPRNLFLAGNATIGGAQTLTGALTVDSTTDSSSTTTGSIQTDGGVGIAKALYVGGVLLNLRPAGLDSYINHSTTGINNTVMGFNNSGSTNSSGVVNNTAYIGSLNAYSTAVVGNGALIATFLSSAQGTKGLYVEGVVTSSGSVTINGNGLDINPASGVASISLRVGNTYRGYIEGNSGGLTLGAGPAATTILSLATTGAAITGTLTSTGNVGAGTTTTNYPLSFSGNNSTYQATGTQMGFGSSGFSGYGPHIGTNNRTYIHLIGSGGGSVLNTWIHGYQVGNPAGSNWMRVAPGISGNPVSGLTIENDAVKWYYNASKTTGDPDYTPTLYHSLSATGLSVTGTTTSTGRYIVSGSSNAGTTDISYGSYAGGNWINTPSGYTGYLAVAGTSVATWNAANVDVPVGSLTVTGAGSRGVRLRGVGAGEVAIAGDGTTYVLSHNFYNTTSYATQLGGLFTYVAGGAMQYLSIGTGYNTAGIYVTAGNLVGINTDQPSNKLQVNSAAGLPSGSDIAEAAILVKDTASNRRIGIGTYASGTWIQSAYPGVSGPAYNLILNPNGGSVGVGTSTPAGAFTIGGSGALQQYFISSSASSVANAIVSLCNNAAAYSNLSHDALDYSWSCSGTARFSIQASGILTSLATYNNTSAGTPNMFVQTDGTIYRGGVSALKYKQDIRDLELIDINKFRAVRYKSKCEMDDQTIDYFGIIADEVDAAGIKELVTYGADGEVESFMYERLTVVLLKNVQELKAEFDAYKASHP